MTGSPSLNIVLGILVAITGICVIIWHRQISITWWKHIVKGNDKILPGVYDKAWRIMDLRTPEKSWWITFWGCILIVAGIFSFLVAYVIAFGPIHS